MNHVEIIIRMAEEIMNHILQIEFATIPEDRQRVIAAAASQEFTDWLHVLLDHLPQLRAHLREFLKEEEEHGI